MRFRSLLALLTLALALVVTGGPAHAAPGDNHVPDDPFGSARTQWWRTDHFGMFIHFGLYSAYRGEYTRSNGTVCRDAEWIRRNCSIPWNEYEAKAATFNPSGFDANAVVSAAKNGGQKYIVVTTKHHDGFAMWPTAVNDWNIHDRSPFKRDILAELATAARAQGVKLGFYYSIWDWHDPDAQPGSTNYQAYLTRMRAQLRELLTNYGDIAELWFDGEWEAPWTAAEGTKLEDYVRGLSPNTIVNNRVGTRTIADGDFGTPEQEIPATPTDAQLWESCMTINDHWGYASYDSNFKSTASLTRNLVGIAASSGNYLLNVGPDDHGVIPQPEVDRLAGMGAWLTANGPAVYGAGYTGLVTRPTWGVVSRAGNKLYASVYTWPGSGGTLHLTATTGFTVTGAHVLRTGASVPVTAAGDGFDLKPTGAAPDPIASVIVLDIAPQTAAPVGTGTGLTAQFWANPTFTGPPAVTRTDAGVNYNWRDTGSPAPAIPTDNFAGRWTGLIEPRFTERYTFATLSDDTVRLWIDGQQVIANTTPHGATVDKGSITLTAGQRYAITLEQTENGGDASAKLFWSSPNTPQQIVPASQLYPGTVLNDNAAGVTYTGAWNVSANRTYAADYNADVHYTTTNGDAVSYAFTGTGVDFRTERYSDQGLVDFYLDGVLKATVDTTNPTRLSQQLVYSARGLAPGSHTLRAVKRSGTYMLVDRIDVFA
ncbi:alpha-L-fucosidase [Longispora sp. K20-0274]|uniref:alpha-L-fucosidase n=1 Tax=Longispora sp. K20-0274 TaxID=3088255 RepID=UPI00399A7493